MPRLPIVPRTPGPLRRVGRWVAITLLAVAGPARADRTFDFTYAGSITGLPAGKIARVWLPVPPTTPSQDVRLLSRDCPAAVRENVDTLGNRIASFDATVPADGVVRYATVYRVTRHAIDAQPVAPGENVPADLRPDRLVPIDGRPLGLLAGKVLPAGDTARARVLYDTVYDYLAYSKDKPGWGRGDVLWACDSKSGNCSDFHSLFLSLARASGLPAKMEFGFIVPAADKPPAVANYHCWAFFKADEKEGWTPVDISKAKNRPAEKETYFGHLDADRIAFSTGRDLTLVPAQTGARLNFFVYPYAEVDGQPVPPEQIERAFSAKDAPSH